MPSVLMLSTATTFRGGERQAFVLTTGLKRLGWDVVLAAPSESQLRQRVEQEGIQTACLSSTVELSPLNFFTIRSLVKNHHPDILHCNDAHALGIASWGGTLKDRPVTIAHRRMIWPIKGRFKYTRIADAVIAVSSSVKQALVACGVNEHSVFTIPSSVDPFFLETSIEKDKARLRLNLPLNVPIILYAAAFTREKGHQLLFDSYYETLKARPDALLCLAGAGELEGLFKATAPQGTRFLGSLSSENMVAAYCAADLFAFAGAEEGLGTASIESQACGTPVVAVNCGGVAETVENGVTGFLCEQSATSFSKAIVQLIDNPVLRNQMGANARERAAELFSPEKMVTDTVNLYKALLETRRASSTVKGDA